MSELPRKYIYMNSSIVPIPGDSEGAQAFRLYKAPRGMPVEGMVSCFYKGQGNFSQSDGHMSLCCCYCALPSSIEAPRTHMNL